MAQFQPGQSGNPAGRPKDSGSEVKKLAREHCAEAIATLAEIMREGNHRDRVAASVALLDRGYGKPAQTIGGDPEGAPVAMSVTWVKPDK